MLTTLVTMAEGIGSRFGGRIKQLESVGMNGEIIMNYSIQFPLLEPSIKVSLFYR